ncbi:MAG: hypothetical protein IKF11_04475 [Methanobrevibacter sp.]|nr:hypothetical protein [Methanobrevibacter sp.]
MASDYGEGIINRLHPDSPLRQEGNPARTLIMKTIGAWLDNYDVTELYDNGFLETATGKWLDLYGKDLGVVRQLDESDEDYRTRLIYESVGNLSMDYLLNVFDLSLYSFREDFNVVDNTLVSDNCFLNTGGYIGVASEDVISLLDRKLLLDGSISWVTEYGSLEYILNTQGINILSNYSKIYELTNGYKYFYKNTTIKKVQLFLPNMNTCNQIFRGCSNLESVKLILPNISYMTPLFYNCTNLKSLELSSYVSHANYLCSDSNLSSLKNVKLDLPNVISCVEMLRGCSALKNVYLNLPKLDDYSNMFNNDSNIETINVNIPTTIVNNFKSYVTGLNLQHLTSFIINGEEQL